MGAGGAVAAPDPLLGLRERLLAVEQVVQVRKDVVARVDEHPAVLGEGDLAPRRSAVGPQRGQVLVGHGGLAGEGVEGVAVGALEVVHARHQVLREEEPLAQQAVARVGELLGVVLGRRWEEAQQAAGAAELVVEALQAGVGVHDEGVVVRVRLLSLALGARLGLGEGAVVGGAVGLVAAAHLVGQGRQGLVVVGVVVGVGDRQVVEEVEGVVELVLEVQRVGFAAGHGRVATSNLARAQGRVQRVDENAQRLRMLLEGQQRRRDAVGGQVAAVHVAQQALPDLRIVKA
ncbi:hypothetical protein VTK26DRAFT_1321 [Humicola hyalothermophila]